MAAASCRVWLGGLSMQVDEKILLDLFKTFGPIKNVVILRGNSDKSKSCGFVNFLSREAAEVAAQALNGCEIMGHVVQARGPSQLLAAGQGCALGVAERIPLTDCAFYLDGLQCSLNDGECAYRHCARARHSNQVCEKWADSTCADRDCPRRHPKVLRQNSGGPSHPTPRCPSHNAFKCTGECGFEECNTHFMEVEAFQDHVSRGHTKQCSMPWASCAECKAVFFTKEEQQRHPCLNKAGSSGTTAFPVDITQPVTFCQAPATQTENAHLVTPRLVRHACSPNKRTTPQIVHNLSEMPTSVLRRMATAPSVIHRADGGPDQCHCPVASCQPLDRPQGPTKDAVVMCSSCGDIYENSGDALSSFDVPVSSSRGHQCPHSPAVHGGDADGLEGNCHKTPSVEAEPIGVFWDIENCPVPRGKSAMAIVQKIRETFFNGKREVEFMCVCDISKEKKEIIEELNNAQVTVVHINATSKNAADDKLRQSLRRFAQSYQPPATVILVSGDINFAAELSDLRHRHNLRVICLHNAQAQAALLACAHEVRRFDHFTVELPPRNPTKVPEEAQLSSELIVSNLPPGKDVTQIKHRLRKLSDNCGGKVVSVTGQIAVVRFPSALYAARAMKRMDKEVVLGSAIQVSIAPSTSSHFPESPSKHKKPQLNGRQADRTFNSPVRPTRILRNFLRTNEGGVANPQPGAADPQLGAKTTNSGDSAGKGGKGCSHLPSRDQESPDSLGSLSQDEQEPKPGEPPPTAAMPPLFSQGPLFPNGSYPGLWPSPFYQNFAGFPGITPLAQPLLGNPLTASWLASLQAFPVMEQQRGGIDLLVANLDESVGEKELKKKLASVFREHCKVYSVQFQSGEGLPLRAFVKVPRLSDAQLAITKVHGQTIFGACVSVSLATEKDKEFGALRSRVAGILREAPLHWLRLHKFLSCFYEKHTQAFDMNSLGLLHDLVVICGKPGNQTMSLLSRSLGGVRVKVDREQFGEDVHALLKCNKGVVPLVSLAALYWLKFDRTIAVNSGGTPLVEVLAGVPNVRVSDSQMVAWIKQANQGGSFEKLLELERELTELLTPRADFRLPLNAVVSEYQKCFDRQSPFDPSAYGFPSLVDLLETIPTTVQVVEEAGENFLTLTLKARTALFARNLRQLLHNQPEHVVSLGNLVSVYQKTFGHRCKVANFGFSRLTDLIETLPHVAKLHGSGEQRVVSLVGKEKPVKLDKQVLLHNLSRELKEVVSACEGQQLPVGMVMARYRLHFGCNMKLGDLKPRSLEDLLRSLPGVQVVEIDDEMILTLPPRVTLQSLASSVRELLARQEGRFVLTSRLPSLHLRHYGYKCSLSQANLAKLCRLMANGAQMKGTGSDQVLFLPTDAANGAAADKLDAFAADVTALLVECPGARVARSALPDLYAQHHGQHVRPADFGFQNLDQLLAALPRVVQVVEADGVACVRLTADRLLTLFARDMLALLSAQPDKSLPVRALPAVYRRHFGRLLRADRYGRASLEQLVGAVPSVLTMSGQAAKLQLSPIQSFAVEAQQLLERMRGCVTLNRFAPHFQQAFGRPCRAADYGFTRVAELLAAVPNVVEIRGAGVDKIVLLRERADLLVLGEVSEPIEHQGAAAPGDVQDLIELTSEGRLPDDPLMAPVPNSLPKPGLTPRAVSSRRRSAADLISFAGFNLDFEFPPSHAHSVAAGPEPYTGNLETRAVNAQGEEEGENPARNTADSSAVDTHGARSVVSSRSGELGKGGKSHKKPTRSKVRLAANFNFGVKK